MNKKLEWSIIVFLAVILIGLSACSPNPHPDKQQPHETKDEMQADLIKQLDHNRKTIEHFETEAQQAALDLDDLQKAIVKAQHIGINPPELQHARQVLSELQWQAAKAGGIIVFSIQYSAEEEELERRALEEVRRRRPPPSSTRSLSPMKKREEELKAREEHGLCAWKRG